jgi:hypothetical protein
MVRNHAERDMMDAKTDRETAMHIACLTFDFDAVSGYIAQGQHSPTPISRGEFGLVGAERVLTLLEQHGIPATWFIPGHTIETYPAMSARIAEAGHEIGHHGWTHMSPVTMSRDEEEAGLQRGTDAIVKLCGRNRACSRCPSCCSRRGSRGRPEARPCSRSGPTRASGSRAASARTA